MIKKKPPSVETTITPEQLASAIQRLDLPSIPEDKRQEAIRYLVTRMMASSATSLDARRAASLTLLDQMPRL